MRIYNKEKNTAKVRKWRESHRKEYNEYQKLYKRKIRAAAKSKDKAAIDRGDRGNEGSCN